MERQAREADFITGRATEYKPPLPTWAKLTIAALMLAVIALGYRQMIGQPLTVLETLLNNQGRMLLQVKARVDALEQGGGDKGPGPKKLDEPKAEPVKPVKPAG